MEASFVGSRTDASKNASLESPRFEFIRNYVLAICCRLETFPNLLNNYYFIDLSKVPFSRSAVSILFRTRSSLSFIRSNNHSEYRRIIRGSETWNPYTRTYFSFRKTCGSCLETYKLTKGCVTRNEKLLIALASCSLIFGFGITVLSEEYSCIVDAGQIKNQNFITQNNYRNCTR